MTHGSPTAADRQQIKGLYYESLRTEVMERVKLREQISFGYLAGVSALLGYVLTKETAPTLNIPPMDVLLAVVPLLAYAASVSIARHQEIIGSFNAYLAREEWLDFKVWDYYSATS